MDAKNMYQFCINNCKNKIKDQDPLNPDSIDVFKMSEVLAIAFCKLKEDVIMDLIK